MKFKGKVSFEIESDLVEDKEEKLMIKELHRCFNKIYKRTNSTYIYDLLKDITNTICAGEKTGATLLNGEVYCSGLPVHIDGKLGGTLV